MTSLLNPDAIGVAKKTKWKCVKCGHEQHSAVKACTKCGHEPTAGRRDTTPEGRRYTPTDE